MDENGAVNDVWATLAGKTIDAISSYQNSKVAASQATQLATLDVWKSAALATGATPSGSARPAWNPFAGNFSSYPQADGKTLAQPSAFASFGGFAIVAVIVAVLAALLIRR